MRHAGEAEAALAVGLDRRAAAADAAPVAHGVSQLGGTAPSSLSRSLSRPVPTPR